MIAAEININIFIQLQATRYKMKGLSHNVALLYIVSKFNVHLTVGNVPHLPFPTELFFLVVSLCMWYCVNVGLMVFE